MSDEKLYSQEELNEAVTKAIKDMSAANNCLLIKIQELEKHLTIYKDALDIACAGIASDHSLIQGMIGRGALLTALKRSFLERAGVLWDFNQAANLRKDKEPEKE